MAYNHPLIIILPQILKSPISANTPVIKQSPYRLNNMDDMQHSFLTPLPIFTLSVSPDGDKGTLKNNKKETDVLVVSICK